MRNKTSISPDKISDEIFRVCFFANPEVSYPACEQGAQAEILKENKPGARSNDDLNLSCDAKQRY